jgi:YD repeat-containing protein
MVSCGFTDGAMTQMRQQNAANETTGITGGGWNSPAYDAAGNIVSGPKAGAETTRLHFVYDAWNRLVQVKADSGGQPGAVIATYQYDGGASARRRCSRMF